MTRRDSESLVYARPSVPTGPSGFRSYHYPSDYAGVVNGFCSDDGNVLSLGPTPLHIRLIPVFLLLSLYVVILISSYWHNERVWSWPDSLQPILLLLVPTLFVVVLWRVWSRASRQPWISVDRFKQAVQLPRQQFSLPIASVLRLQLVSFGRVDFFRRLPRSGELQIVFNDGDSEQTRCIIHLPEPGAMKRFARRMQETTGVPMSRVYPSSNGEWRVEPFVTGR